jgi:hypothetical protein
MPFGHRRPFKCGDIVRGIGLGPCDSDEWFVVDEDGNTEYATGPCFISLDESRVGKIFGLTRNQVQLMAPSRVPQFVRVALAKFRLTT